MIHTGTNHQENLAFAPAQLFFADRLWIVLPLFKLAYLAYLVDCIMVFVAQRDAIEPFK